MRLLRGFVIVGLMLGVLASGVSATGTSEPAAGPVTLTVMIGESAQAPIKPEAPAYVAMMRETGVNVEFQAVPSSDYGARVSTLIATDNVPDVMRLGYAQYMDFGASGVFLQLDPHIETHVPNLAALLKTHTWVDRLQIGGALYAFPSISRDYDTVVKSPTMFIRADLLQAQGLAVPSTFGELRDVLAALRTAYPNGLGWITRGSGSLRSLAMYSLGSGEGVYYDPRVNGGSYVYAPATDEYRVAIGYLRQLYSEGLLDPDYAVTSSQAWQEKGGSGLGFFSYDNPIFLDRMNRAMQSERPDARFEYIPVLENDLGFRRYELYVAHPSHVWAISRKTRDQTAVMHLFNWLYSDRGADIRSLGIEGEHWQTVNGRKVVIPSVLDRYRAAGDPYNTMMSDVGIAFMAFTPYLDNTLLAMTQTPELQHWWFDVVANDPDTHQVVLDPPFTKEERDRIRELKSALGTLETEAFDMLVQGAWPMSRIDQVVAQLRSIGYQELLTIYNTANARVK